MEGVRVGDLNFTVKQVAVKRAVEWMVHTAHSVLALPLEQLILNAFEKAPSRERGERDRQPKEDRGEEWKEKNSQSTWISETEVKGRSDISNSSEFMHRQRSVSVSRQVNVSDTDKLNTADYT